MSTYKGPECALCRVIACEAAPGVETPPRFCPAVAESEALAEVEKTYFEEDDLRRMALE